MVVYNVLDAIATKVFDVGIILYPESPVNVRNMLQLREFVRPHFATPTKWVSHGSTWT